MARDEYEYPDYWDRTERELFDDLIAGEPELQHDRHLQDLFDEALFDRDADPADRAEAMEELEAYLMGEYGIDFDSEFDWEEWRDWYDSQ